ATPVRAWLPLVLVLAALASVAPLHAVAATVLIGLPAYHAAARTGDRYRRRRWQRGPRWHDRITRPAVFLREAGAAAWVTATQAAVPLAVVGAATAVAAVAVLPLAGAGRYPMAAARVGVAAAAVAVVLWLVHRLEDHPAFARTFGRDLSAWAADTRG